MPPKRTMLLTDWVTIATAGQTIDGRKIEEFKIIEAAAAYDPEEYCAVINIDHLFGNYGTVRELQTAKDDKGRTILQAKISPNDSALQWNKADLKLFTSVELTANFCGTGKYYLTGLAFTDRPASVGTSELHFKARKNAEAYSAETEIDITVLMALAKNDEENLFFKFTNFLTHNFTLTKKEKAMNEEQFKKLTELLTANGDAVSKMAAAIEALKKEEPKPATPAASENASATAKPETDLGKIVDEKLKPLTESLGKINASLAELFKEKPGTKVSTQTGATTETQFI